MATGIQTGMRSGSRAGLTGRSAAKAGGGGPLGKFTEIWGGLGKGAKIGIGVLIVLVVLGGGFFAHQSSANAFIPLYTTELSPTDKKEVAMKLTELGIDHRVDIVDGILLPPSYRAKAQVALAAHGLPRHPIMTADKSSSMSPKTSAEQKALRQRLLEGELTETIRQVDGVADAYVKLAIPEETYFRDDSRMTTARVLLKMQPNEQLNRQSIGGLVHLIAFAVPELEPEGVKIIDSKGRDLTAMLPQDPNGEGMGGSGTQHETKTQVEKDLETKVQEHLDTILGPGRAKASVNAELDFSHYQKTTKSYGGAGDSGTVIVGKQHKVEKFNKDPHKNTSQGNAQMLSTGATQTSSGSGDKNNYVNETTVTKVKADERTVTTVDKSYRIKRLTCSVTVDNLRDDMRGKVAGIVRSAIGIDEARGDEVVVESLPFHREVMPPATAGMMEPPGGWQSNGAPGAGLNTGHLTAAVTVGAAIFLGLIVMFLVKQNQVHNNQRKPILASGGGATSTGIADLLNEKSGKSTAAGNAGETKVNTTDQLEQLAKERPTKVAEMLKSTWLSG